MRAQRIAAVVVMAAWALAPRAAWASGYAINEFSARPMGMANAFAGIANEASAIYFNPAGLVQLTGLQAEATFTFISPSASYTGLEPGTDNIVEVDAKRKNGYVPAGFGSWRIHDRVAVGIGFFAPFGLTVEWPNQVNVDGQVPWWGRDIVHKIKLQSVFIVPTVAVKVHPRVLLGAGISLVQAAVTLERYVTLSQSQTSDIFFKLSGDDFFVGGTAGILVRVLPDVLHVGVGYRSAVPLTIEGKAAFTNVPVAYQSQLVDGRAKADLTFPHVVSFGVGIFPIPGLTIGVEADLFTWTVYKRLAVQFPEHPSLDISEEKNWHTSVTARVGAEYFVTPHVPLRAGFIFDQTPIPDTTLGPELPDGNRYEFSVGGGYRWRGLYVDAAYQYLSTTDVKTADVAPLVGSYRADAHLASITVGYRLDI